MSIVSFIICNSQLQFHKGIHQPTHLPPSPLWYPNTNSFSPPSAPRSNHGWTCTSSPYRNAPICRTYTGLSSDRHRMVLSAFARAWKEQLPLFYVFPHPVVPSRGVLSPSPLRGLHGTCQTAMLVVGSAQASVPVRWPRMDRPYLLDFLLNLGRFIFLCKW